MTGDGVKRGEKGEASQMVAGVRGGETLSARVSLVY